MTQSFVKILDGLSPKVLAKNQYRPSPPIPRLPTTTITAPVHSWPLGTGSMGVLEVKARSLRYAIAKARKIYGLA
ncbi:hypothetical protein [Moorena sp. SIO3I6]|uniref:hypothetical protein n=1 Tax=Moorena sp. SIO3I6 TaxID=2607831 RepID=UPI0013FA013A|nr:hypothetical protein [Moorena sp. SIO3I6]NEP28648.1 hypothetical protein [Moorena sp. SIO3I6]